MLASYNKIIVAIFVFFAVVLPADAAVRLNSTFSDHMVIQRGMASPIWGVADPGEKIIVTLGESKAEGQADANGNWTIKFSELKPSFIPQVLIVKGTNELRVQDVLVGDVWIGSGQSNMALPVKDCVDAKRVSAAAEASKYNYIRLLQIKPNAADFPISDINDQWQLATGDNLDHFSALLFLFGESLHKEYPQVPLGLINSSVGGTNAYCWIPNRVFKDAPALKSAREWYHAELAQYDAHKSEYDKKLDEFKTKFLALKTAGQPIPRSLVPPVPPMSATNQNRPCGLYNAMIAPLEPLAMRGVIWYQGENDSFLRFAKEYHGTLKALVQGWRNDWAKGHESTSSDSVDFPFLIVQLPNFVGSSAVDWPLIREAQLHSSAELVNSGLVVTIDIGDPKSIHPRDKSVVAQRLAHLAASVAYHKPAPSGPVYKSNRIDGNVIKCTFETEKEPIKPTEGGHLSNFSICDDTHKFIPAVAVIDNHNDVNVSSPEILKPKAVRYAWENAPKSRIDFYNTANIPASPFRTDNFPSDNPE